jgi:hypothetical protein
VKTYCWILLAALVAPSAGAASPTLQETARLELPPRLSGASDLRFEDGQILLLSVRGVGAVRARFDGTSLASEQVLVPEGSDGGIVIPEHLGASPALLAVSAPMSQLVWIERGRGRASGRLGTWDTPDTAPISFFEDIDVSGRRLAILGLMRSESGMSPDGAIAWIGQLGAGDVELRPLAYSLAGKGAQPFDACSVFAVGKVRFLAGGEILLVPGAEPGVYLYSTAGKLLRTWDSGDLGLDLRCDFGEEKMLHFNSDVHARLDYVNRFVTVDEVLPTEHGPALLIRSADGKGTRWTLALLGDDGSVRKLEVPIRSPSRRAHLRGDVLGDRLLLILREFLPEKGKQRETTEIVELRLSSPPDLETSGTSRKD